VPLASHKADDRNSNRIRQSVPAQLRSRLQNLKMRGSYCGTLDMSAQIQQTLLKHFPLDIKSLMSANIPKRHCEKKTFLCTGNSKRILNTRKFEPILKGDSAAKTWAAAHKLDVILDKALTLIRYILNYDSIATFASVKMQSHLPLGLTTPFCSTSIC